MIYLHPKDNKKFQGKISKLENELREQNLSNDELVNTAIIPLYKIFFFQKFGFYEDECAKSEAAMMIMHSRIKD